MGKRRKRNKKKGQNARREIAGKSASSDRRQRDFSALILALLSFFMLWLSMPGPGRAHWWLAWISLVPLVWLIQSPSSPHKLIRQVWIASMAFWFVVLHFVRLPFWALWFGWFALATYLSVYGPLFVWTSRTMVHRLRIPTVVAVPVAITGLEWIRVTFLSGFGLACISHSQFKNPATMQIAEFAGAYGVTFAIACVSSAVAVATSFSWRKMKAPAQVPVRIVHGIIAVAVMAGVVGFGARQLKIDAAVRKSAESHRHLKVALIQPSIDTVLKPMTLEEVDRDFIARSKLTHAARFSAKDLDLIVWPESSFAYADFLSDVSATDTVEMRKENLRMAWQAATGTPVLFPEAVPLLVGSTTLNPQDDEVFNSAILFDRNGEVVDRYYKIHLVMFGEYFPIVHSIPVLKDFVKGFRTLNDGEKFSSFGVGDATASANICFETTVPHLIRRQVNSLEASGKNVDVLFNVTNDGWFFGTSCLDLHLACNTFRAIEIRKPVLVSANTGFSAHIDEFGRHVKVGPRREEASLICDVRVPYAETTIYRQWGAWIATVMGGLVVLVAVIARFLPSSSKD